MDRKIYIVMHSDIMHYPPMISLIDIMLELGEKIVYIGDFSDSPTVRRFTESGVEFIKIYRKQSDNWIHILKEMLSYKKELAKFLDSKKLSEKDILWYVFGNSAPCVHDVISKYNYLIQYYEFERQDFNWRFKMFFPSFNHERFAKGAITTIQCEYNRAQIFRGLNGLDYSPFVLPNKPFIKKGAMDENTMPIEVKTLIESVKSQVAGKKVLLYQGIFDSRERKLEEFCEAVKIMPEEYAFIAMGRGDSSFDDLKSKYQSDRILFIPFIIPPFHLHITQLASIGVLSYSPVNKSVNGVINPLYCAPNKIFEYGMFSKPMISNDIPGLRFIFEKYNCGSVVEYPLTPSRIKTVLENMFANYNQFTNGSKEYYESVDMKVIVVEILKAIRSK